MVKTKVGGIMLGGLAAYLILSKGLNVVNNCVRNMCVAHEWKNYYKYGKEGNMVPPGYQMHTHTNESGENVDVGTPSAIKQEEAKRNGNGNASQKPLSASISEAIVRVINDVFVGDKKAEEASEGPGEQPSCEEHVDLDKDDGPAIDFSENPDGEFVDKEENT